jgi:hypothetical protein
MSEDNKPLIEKLFNFSFGYGEESVLSVTRARDKFVIVTDHNVYVAEDYENSFQVQRIGFIP